MSVEQDGRLQAERPHDYSLSEISEETGIPPSTVISTMISLEILHRVRKNPDGTYSKKR